MRGPACTAYSLRVWVRGFAVASCTVLHVASPNAVKANLSHAKYNFLLRQGYAHAGTSCLCHCLGMRACTCMVLHACALRTARACCHAALATVQ